MKTRLAAGFGFLAVLLGALGAHGGVHALLVERQGLELWKTASLYHLAHAVVLLALALSRVRSRTAFVCFSAGVAIFSGTLYALALTQIKWLGAVTPVGGLLLMAGWLVLLWRPTQD